MDDKLIDSLLIDKWAVCLCKLLFYFVPFADAFNKCRVKLFGITH